MPQLNMNFKWANRVGIGDAFAVTIVHAGWIQHHTVTVQTMKYIAEVLLLHE